MNQERGNTFPRQGETQQRTPREPHERDESADSQASAEASQGAIGKQAHEDAAKGLRDTSKAEELERTYDRLRDSGAAPPDEAKPRR